MKHLMVIVLATFLLVSVAPQPAQSGVGAFLTWWDAEDMDTGFGGGLKYEFPLIPIVSIDARVSYISFSDVDLYTIPIEAVGTAKLGMFYGGLALGYYIWDGIDADTSAEIGGSILAGISLGLGSIGAFGEIRYNVVKTRVADTFDMNADGFSINLGVHF